MTVNEKIRKLLEQDRSYNEPEKVVLDLSTIYAFFLSKNDDFMDRIGYYRFEMLAKYITKYVIDPQLKIDFLQFKKNDLSVSPRAFSLVNDFFIMLDLIKLAYCNFKIFLLQLKIKKVRNESKK